MNYMRSDRYKNLPTPWYKQFWGWVIIAAFVIGIGGIILTAVFDGGSKKATNTTSSDVDNVTDVSKPQGSFDGHTAKLPKYTIKIKDVSIGETDEGKKCMVFDYTVYNKSAKDMSASDAWMQTFSAYQPDKNTQNLLDQDVGDVDDSLSDEMNQEINKGGHAKGEFIALLKNDKKPVILKAKDETGNLIGKHKYNFKIKSHEASAASKSSKHVNGVSTNASSSDKDLSGLSSAEKANVARGLEPDGTTSNLISATEADIIALVA